MQRLILPAVLFFAGLFAGTSSGAIVVDQEQLQGPSELSVLNNQVAVQSFQQSAGNITGASVIVGPTPIGSVTIELYDDLDDVGNVAERLAVGTLTADPAVGFASSFVAVDFGGAVFITPSSTLFLRFSKTSLPESSNVGSFQGIINSVDQYTLGEAFINGMPAISNSNADFAFQTFTDTTAVAAVPEPSSGIFMVASGMFVACRRRR